MKIVETVSLAELRDMAEKMYGSLVKADVDMGMHADGEQVLLENGSLQQDVWGINIHPDNYGSDEFIEFDSMINIRPRQNNPSRDVHDDTIRAQIRTIVAGIVHE